MLLLLLIVCCCFLLIYFRWRWGKKEISDLLSMDKHIDLIIPRGSSELVRSIQQQSQHIPVLGHAEGICHVFVDKDADLQKALKIIRDAKCDYPAGE